MTLENTNGNGSNGTHRDEERSSRKKPNIMMVGVMGSGKSTIGERLAYYIGYGFVDVDRMIEQGARKSVAEIFAKDGEPRFRELERGVIANLKSARNQVVSVGGGAVMNADNWQDIKANGTVVWLNTPPVEIARRFVMKPDEIRSRPLLSDLVEIEDKQERQKQLTDRIAALVGQRMERYSGADLVLEVSYSTAETSAQLLKAMLSREGFI